jgi:REP element-mobilizing transposase RayT
MARSRYRFVDPQAPHFITVTIVEWVPLFGSKALAKIVLDSLQFLQDHDRITLYAYVILENHVHLVAAGSDLSKEIGDFKSFTARQIVDHLLEHNAQRVLKQLSYYKLRHKADRDFQVWREGSHPQLIQGDDMMRQKITYIHNNPVKRGYVDEPCHWRYSSARNYAQQEGLIRVTTTWSDGQPILFDGSEIPR